MASYNSDSRGYMLTRVEAQQQTMKALAGFLPSPDSRSDAPPAPDLFTALQQQLGLQLERKKIPLDVVVVESVARMPSEKLMPGVTV